MDFHYKPSIWRYHYFRKPPFIAICKLYFGPFFTTREQILLGIHSLTVWHQGRNLQQSRGFKPTLHTFNMVPYTYTYTYTYTYINDLKCIYTYNHIEVHTHTQSYTYTVTLHWFAWHCIALLHYTTLHCIAHIHIIQMNIGCIAHYSTTVHCTNYNVIIKQ